MNCSGAPATTATTPRSIQRSSLIACDLVAPATDHPAPPRALRRHRVLATLPAPLGLGLNPDGSEDPPAEQMEQMLQDLEIQPSKMYLYADISKVGAQTTGFTAALDSRIIRLPDLVLIVHVCGVVLQAVFAAVLAQELQLDTLTAAAMTENKQITRTERIVV